MRTDINRRAFLGYFSSIGLGTTLLPGVLWSNLATAQSTAITSETIRQAEQLAGLEFTDEERDGIVKGIRTFVNNYETLRKVPLSNDVPPALHFNPVLPGMKFNTESKVLVYSNGPMQEIPVDFHELAFWPIMELAKVIKAQKITSTALTNLYLDRLKRYGPALECVINLTEERALAQAKQADKEISSGNYRGPLHGIPWGAKDLLSVKGYPTTWGAMPYKDRIIDTDATVVQRLDAAGAVLVAKLTLGALAQGDVWFGGKTKCPWNPKRGSSGSSAGPGAATAAGLVGFSIGSETNGSIMSPATVNGVSGLRPTFGRISRHGAMALSWSMDKLGPMCRSVEDCAMVLDAVMGSDDHDMTVRDLPFNWNAKTELSRLRVGYLNGAFDEDSRNFNSRALNEIRDLGINPQPINMPELPYNAMNFILTVEGAAAFDEFTRSNLDDELVSQHLNAWPSTFRRARMVPAVEYIQANRVRTRLMEAMQLLFNELDVLITPSVSNLLLGNFTGHPMISVPNGFNKKSGVPTSIGFMGRLYGEADMMALAYAYQESTIYHQKYPDMSEL